MHETRIPAASVAGSLPLSGRRMNFMRRGAPASFALLLVFLCGCLSPHRPEDRQGVSAAAIDPVAAETAKIAPVDARSIYLSPGDEIRITVQGRPEMSRQFVIPPDGRFFYPFVGEVSVEGLTVSEMRLVLTAELADSSRVLSAGDELAIRVFRHAEFDAEAVIPQDGMFPVPLAPPVHVIGLTPQEAGAAVAAALRTYIRQPQVTARVTRYGTGLPVSSPQLTIDLIRLTGERFFVLGEVRAPGVYPLAGQVHVLEAVATAGGVTREGQSGAALLIRAGRPGQPIETEKVDLNRSLQGKGGGQDLVVRAGDVVFVPEASISQVARFCRMLSDILSPIIDLERGVWLGQNIAAGPDERAASETTTRLIEVER